MVINATAARTIWGTDDPLTTPVPRGDRTINVVGVAGDVRYEDIEADPKPAVFFPVAQMTRTRAMLFVRTAGDPASLASVVRNEVKAVDRNHTVSEVATLRDRMYDATARDRFATQVLSAFAVTALLLAAIGIYGVLAFSVEQRTGELGVRMAIGARGADIVNLVLKQGVRLALYGLGIGIVGSLVLTRFMESQLFNVKSGDPVTMLVVVAVLGAVAMVACWLPARRAAKTSPIEALRYE
jgi:ABC-type antimicrobial peptide transport system permease subunit